MRLHLLRWIAQLSNLIVSATHLVGEKEASRNDFLDLAERVEALAKNIRDRAPSE